MRAAQAAAINDIQRDLSTDTPMDRLVIGDVGFGKTEVAMHAIFRAVQSGQVRLPKTPHAPWLVGILELHAHDVARLGHLCPPWY